MTFNEFVVCFFLFGNSILLGWVICRIIWSSGTVREWLSEILPMALYALYLCLKDLLFFAGINILVVARRLKKHKQIVSERVFETRKIINKQPMVTSVMSSKLN